MRAASAIAVLRPTHLKRARHLVQEYPWRIGPLLGPLEVGRHPAQRRHVLAGVRVGEHQILEIGRGKPVDDDVAGGPGRMEARLRPVEPLDAEQVARAPDVAQFRVTAGLVPERDRALLDHEDVQLVRLPLPQDEFIGFVKSDAAVRGERQKVGILHRMKRRVLLQEVDDAVADG